MGLDVFKLSYVQSDDESDTEKQEVKQEVKQEDEQKNLLDQKAGTGSKGLNAAASSSKLKSAPDSKKVNSLKRPGSPNLSEMESSGNESSRKRPKKTATGSFRDSRASTPVQSSQRLKKASGAASDGEATATEMSDGGRNKVKKKALVVGSHGKGTPTGSRAGSPVPGSSQFPSGKDRYFLSKSPSYLWFSHSRFPGCVHSCSPLSSAKLHTRFSTSKPRW